MPKDKKYLHYIHNFRGLAILYIVIYHAIFIAPWDNPMEKRVWTAMFISGTTLFVFIAGFLFQFLNRHKFSYGQHLKKKLLYVALPYLIFSIPAIVEKLFLSTSSEMQFPDYYESLQTWQKVIWFLITGKHFGPFWFLPMIFLFYAISPLLIMLDRWKIYDRVFFLMIFIGGFFFFRYGHFTNPFVSFVYFIPIYMFGMYASARIELFTSLKKHWLIILSAAYLILFALEVAGVLPVSHYYDSNATNTGIISIINFSKIKLIILTTLFFYLFYHRLNNRNKLLNIMADCSFGIYFVHLYLIKVGVMASAKVGLDITNMNSMSFVLFAIIAIIASVILVQIIKKIFGRWSRYVVGS